MTKGAATELAKYGIRVNSIHPGAIKTRMIADDSFDDAAFIERNKERMPIRRLGTSEDVAEAVVFLASDRSSQLVHHRRRAHGRRRLGDRVSLVRVTEPVDGVRLITLDRPERLNTMTVGLVTQLHQAISEVGADRACRVVVLTGAGSAFCAGLDLQGYGDDERAQRVGPIRGALTRQEEIATLAQRLVRLRQPVIAAVNGAAAGGGLALVLASDIRIAVDSAVFAVAFIGPASRAATSAPRGCCRGSSAPAGRRS